MSDLNECSNQKNLNLSKKLKELHPLIILDSNKNSYSLDNWNFINEVNGFLKETNPKDRQIEAVFVYLKLEP